MRNIIVIIMFAAVLNNLFCGEIKVLKPQINESLEIEYNKEIESKLEKAKKIYEEKYEKNIKMTKEEEELLSWASEKELDYTTDGDGDNWYCGGGPHKIKASSELENEGKNKYSAENAHDNDLRTAWVVKNYGVGEYIEYYFEPFSPRVNKVIIYNGYKKDVNLWNSNSRVKKLKMYINNKPYAILEVADTRDEQVFEFEPLQSKIEGKDLILKFEIMEYYAGKKYKDTAISELSFDGLDVLCFPATTKISLSDNSVKSIDQIKSGDEILTYNSDENKFEKTKVVSTAKVMHNNLVEIDFGDNIITSTDDHPYLSENGWKSCKPNGTKNYKGYENIKELKIGDKIYFIGENGKTELKEVKGIKKVDKKEMCYTITKLTNGNNFIADGAVVGVEEIEKIK